MVILRENSYIRSDIEDAPYQEHFGRFPYDLSGFQKDAIRGIVDGHSVLVTAPTGSGKTLPAEFCIQYMISKGKKIIYASPIKALSNQKFFDFTQKYGADMSIGIMTGDIKHNPDAQCLIMTTEILYNYLFSYRAPDPEPDAGSSLKGSSGTLVEELSTYSDGRPKEVQRNMVPALQFQMDIDQELGCVIFDEIHYINDLDRGKIWEGTILMLPPHVQILGLSATLQNPRGFAEWIECTQRQVVLASTSHRIVPLAHYMFLTHTESIFKQTKDKELHKYVRDSTHRLLMVQDAKGQFQDDNYHRVSKVLTAYQKYHVYQNRKHVLNALCTHLRDEELLPAIFFIFSRKHVETCARDITVNLLEFDSKVPYIARRECEQIVRKLPNYAEYLKLPEYESLVQLLEKGIGIHHAGMLPVLREIVELFMTKKYIKVLCCTETFAIGLDCAIRTAVFTNTMKFDGQRSEPRYLHAHEYAQAGGRAGRRGHDTIGYAIHCNNLFPLPTINEYKTLLSGKPQALVSKFKISYSLVLNLIKHGKTTMDDFGQFVEKSMIYGELQHAVGTQRTWVDELTATLARKEAALTALTTPQYVCIQYMDIGEQLKLVSQKKRKELERERERIRQEYRHLDRDLVVVQTWRDLVVQCKEETRHSHYLNTYLTDQVTSVCDVLVQEGFLRRDEAGAYAFTELGTIATCMAEIHPLVMSKVLADGGFGDVPAVEMVGFLSAFCDVKVADDQRSGLESVAHPGLRARLEPLQRMFDHFQDLESARDMSTGINYDQVLQYNLVDAVMEWCHLADEPACKQFIGERIQSRGISLGDFTKVILKISAIVKEIIHLCETTGKLELLQTLVTIDGMILKYVIANQSLYV